MIELEGPSEIITSDERLTVYNDGQVIYLDGKPVKRDITSYQLTCNVQPLNGRDLLLVPEHDRFKEQYWVFTNEIEQPLKVNQRLIRNSISFQVQEVEQWGSYQRARIMRIDVGPYATNP